VHHTSAPAPDSISPIIAVSGERGIEEVLLGRIGGRVPAPADELAGSPEVTAGKATDTGVTVPGAPGCIAGVACTGAGVCGGTIVRRTVREFFMEGLLTLTEYCPGCM